MRTGRLGPVAFDVVWIASLVSLTDYAYDMEYICIGMTRRTNTVELMVSDDTNNLEERRS